jgi:tetratricopeptide (TPR) repeat protein
MVKSPRSQRVLLVFVALALLFGITAWLANVYHAERRHRAEAYYRRAENLARAGRLAEGVEVYRAAIGYAPDNARYQLALGLALMDLGRLQEARSHLLEMHESDPANAWIDLLLARISAREDRIDEAVTEYHQAIYGLWPRDAGSNRIQAGFELVDLLERTGRTGPALAELLALSEETPQDPTTQTRVAFLLLEHGSAPRASEMFLNVVARNPHNAAAALGCGEAAFAQGNYAAAENWFRKAVQWDPSHAEAATWLEETAEIRALDPTPVTLSAAARYERVRTLVSRTLDGLEACAAPGSSAEIENLIPEAQEFLRKNRVHHEGDTPRAVELAEQLWQARKQVCGKPPKSEEALDLVMAKVAK